LLNVWLQGVLSSEETVRASARMPTHAVRLHE
jgi:hypothetical protein